MMAKLRSHRHSEEQLNKSLLLRHIADNEIIVNVFPPDVGEYGLELYACDPKSDGGSYYMVISCSYNAFFNCTFTFCFQIIMYRMSI